MSRSETKKRQKLRTKIKKSIKEGKKPNNPLRIKGRFGMEEDRLGMGGMDLALSDKKAKEAVFGKKRSILDTLLMAAEAEKARKKASKTVPKFMNMGGVIPGRGGSFKGVK
jgi:hypothetical protein